MTYRHILVAYDFSDSGEKALQKAHELAGHHQAKLHILHVVEYLPPVDTSFGAVSPFEVDLTDQLIDSAKSRLAAVAEKVGVPEGQRWVELGSPKLEIIRVAEKMAADLIVVGTHGRHGFGLLLGSTAASVVNHALCDVLSVRGMKE
jgi:universal stress protein A